MKRAIISTIAELALLAGCGTTVSKKPAKAQPARTAAKVELARCPHSPRRVEGRHRDRPAAPRRRLPAWMQKTNGAPTALHYTARGGKAAVAGLLISNSADVNARDADGLTPLHYRGNCRPRGSGQATDRQGCGRQGHGGKIERKVSPIFSAVAKSRGNLVELLLAKGADVNAKDAFAESPLDSAVKEGLPEMVKLLIAKGAKVNGDGGTTPLHKSASTGQKEIVELLLANGANVNVTIAFGDTPLDWADRNNKEDVAAILLKTRRQNRGRVGIRRQMRSPLPRYSQEQGYRQPWCIVGCVSRMQSITPTLCTRLTGVRNIRAVKQHLAAGVDANDIESLRRFRYPWSATWTWSRIAYIETQPSLRCYTAEGARGSSRLKQGQPSSSFDPSPQ